MCDLDVCLACPPVPCTEQKGNTFSLLSSLTRAIQTMTTSPSSANSAPEHPGASDSGSLPSPKLQAPVIYDGGFPSAKETGVLLRIGCGGAGQIGLIAAFANAFIQHWAGNGNDPFQVESPS